MNESSTQYQNQVERERAFHNEWAESINLDELLVREAFESPTAIENKYALSQLGNLQGKELLDLGCGAGETSVYFALQGAKVTALDVAENFLNVARALAKKYGVEITTTAAEAGRLPYEDNSFDFVFGNGVLHHVELESAATEIKRVLKPGGRAVFIEPLPYNPIINLYRVIAKEVRTEDEKPLSYKKLASFSAHYTSSHHEEFWFVSLYMFIHFYLIKRWNPNKVRYWKRIIEVGPAYKGMFGFLQKLDKFLLKVLPFFRPLCWNTVLVVNK